VSSGNRRSHIIDRCHNLKAVLADAPKAPRSLEFCNRLGEIKNFAEEQPELAGTLLDELMCQLKVADDGCGGLVLDFTRHQQFLSDPLFAESVAYHEAGHMVVAAAQGIKLRTHGIHVDGKGRGISYYENLGASGQGSSRERTQTIISLFAGLIAQQEFLPGCSSLCASDDIEKAEALLRTLVSPKAPDLDEELAKLRRRLYEESKASVTQFSVAIEGLAKALLQRPFTRRQSDEPEKRWSTCVEEKQIDGEGVACILSRFGITVSISTTK